MKKIFFRLATAATLISPLANGPTPATAASRFTACWVRSGHPDDQLEFYDCLANWREGTLPLPDCSPAPEICAANAAKNGANKVEGRSLQSRRRQDLWRGN